MDKKKKLKSSVSKLIEKHGFTQKGEFGFSKLVGDVVMYFTIEAPKTFIYVWFCIYPIFMPPLPTVKYMPYGKRLNAFCPATGVLSVYDDDETVKSKLYGIECCLNDIIDPISQQFLSKASVESLFILCNSDGLTAFQPSDFCRLMLYSKLYSGDYKDALKYADAYREEKCSGIYTEAVERAACEEVARIKALLKLPDKHIITDIVDSYKHSNLELFGYTPSV